MLIGCSETRTVSAQSALFVCCCEHSRCVQNFSALIRSVQFDKLFTSVMYNKQAPTFVQRRIAFAVRGRVFIEHDVRRSPKFVCVSLFSSGGAAARRLYILCWSELSRRRLLPAVSPAAGHLTTPTVSKLPSLCETFRPTTSKSKSSRRGQRRRQLTPAMLPPA